MTFNSPLQPHPPTEIQKIYKGIVGLDLPCTDTDLPNIVCPAAFNG